ncbi:MAG: hypothetical protein AAF264_02835 [Pseudomonadota bacterium]
MAQIDQWLDWYATVMWPPGRLLFLGICRDRRIGWADAETRELAGRRSAACAVLDGVMAHRPFVTGESFSIADIAIAIGANRIDGMRGPVPLPGHVQDWLERMRARAAFAVATAEEPVLAGIGAES